ncbi:hypothetical protein MFIFM68171_07162 [Madurella fahalii]|uniref:Heterokaryon incompatibility domain-containing protein n=1 Tax=Madurella fahalii TaxID=1157608 RepID=A0ABQ0GGT1_9PEZI
MTRWASKSAGPQTEIVHLEDESDYALENDTDNGLGMFDGDEYRREMEIEVETLLSLTLLDDEALLELLEDNDNEEERKEDRSWEWEFMRDIVVEVFAELPNQGENNREEAQLQRLKNALQLRYEDRADGLQLYESFGVTGDALGNSDENWEHSVDNDFAETFFEQLGQLKPLLQPIPVSRLCDRCRSIDLRQAVSLQSLDETSDSSCDLCQLLRGCLVRRNIEVIQPLESRSVVRVFADLGTQPASAAIQTGFPTVLPEAGGPVQFELIREWIKVCDDEHDCSKDRRSFGENPVLPTRVLDVGDRQSHRIRLHDEEEKAKFTTTAETVDARYQVISLDDLPQSFRDAVRVTRELGLRYLWIDSLCIIQGPDGDWETESVGMQAIFQDAYCTIAANSASDSTKGFPSRASSAHISCIAVPYSSHGPVYVCEAIDDFHRDVERSVLNQRAWVLQERALSRRTIHFTDRQIYWECGNGIHCAKPCPLQPPPYISSRSIFLGDPDFPDALGVMRNKGQVELFQYLFTTYTGLGITEITDRPIAIAGLEERLAEVLDRSNVVHGVFEKFLHRSLLWRRHSGIPKMLRIRFRNGCRVPSWSWMAYDGEIENMPVPFSAVEWSRTIKLGKKLIPPWRDACDMRTKTL